MLGLILAVVAILSVSAAAMNASYESQQGPSSGPCPVLAKEQISGPTPINWGPEKTFSNQTTCTKAYDIKTIPYDVQVPINIPVQRVTDTRHWAEKNVTIFETTAVTGVSVKVAPLAICGNCSAILGDCNWRPIDFAPNATSYTPILKSTPSYTDSSSWVWANRSAMAWANTTEQIKTETTTCTTLKDTSREGDQVLDVYDIGVPEAPCTAPACAPSFPQSNCQWQTPSGKCETQLGLSALPCDNSMHRGEGCK